MCMHTRTHFDNHTTRNTYHVLPWCSSYYFILLPILFIVLTLVHMCVYYALVHCLSPHTTHRNTTQKHPSCGTLMLLHTRHWQQTHSLPMKVNYGKRNKVAHQKGEHAHQHTYYALWTLCHCLPLSHNSPHKAKPRLQTPNVVAYPLLATDTCIVFPPWKPSSNQKQLTTNALEPSDEIRRYNHNTPPHQALNSPTPP